MFRGLVLAWVVMLALGHWHHKWPIVPAFGYFTVLLLLTLTIIIRGISRYRRAHRSAATASFYFDGTRYRRR